MGATYTRQSTYSDGDVITAAHTNDEFNQLLAAFQASSGHTHDGTANEGGPITKMLGTSLTLGDGTASTDITVTFDGESNDGVLKWMEDEDYFEFSDDILVASTEKIQFGDTATFLQQSSDGVLRIDGEATIDLNASTAVTVSNDLKLDSDSAVLGFGADNDVTLTHVADTALLLNDAIKLTFRDSALSVSSSTDGQLDIDADTEVEITTPLLEISADATVGDDLTLKSDAAVLGFGADTDTTLTHVADTGLLLNSTRQLQFGDSGTYIHQSADGVLDLVADTEIEINATTIDINGAADISGNLAVGGNLTVTGTMDFGDSNISNVGSIALDTITNDGTDITLDSSGDIILDAGGDDITFKSGGTEFGSIFKTSNDLYLNSAISDGDIKFRGNDGGSFITALTLDMSDAGAATFNAGATFGSAITATQSSAATAATFKVGDNSAQVANLVVSNDADTGLNLGVFGSSAGTAGMISASDAFITTSTTELNVGVNNSSGVIKFGIGSTASEITRITSDGHVLIGTTTNQGVGGISFQHNASAGVNIQQNMDGTSGGAELYVFRRNSTKIGSINQSSTNAVTYNTSSDARLKDVTGSSRGLDVINNLNPVAYNWKADNHADEGLIEQEVEKLVPNAVNQDEDGYYSMDYSKLVTHLVKGMQEQQEQIESLKSEIENLKEK